ncbi:MAG: acetylxylan esterase [Planctomycetes bacterium]|nr:acetylxylan esterase [Planctomycetota bacterium]
MRDGRRSKAICIVRDAAARALRSALALFACGAGLEAQDDAARLRDFRHTDTRFEGSSPVDATAWRARAEALRSRVRWAAGLLPELPRPPVHAEIVPRWEDARFRVSTVRFESAPGLFVFGNLYEPLDASRPRPVVLSPHGHWGGGRFENSAACSVPARCVALARAGAVVFAYDMLGFGDSKHQLVHREARFESADAERYGLTSFALQTWSSIRALDFVLALPAIDAARVAITGASGGGTQSFVLACVDPRVTVSVPVNMVSFTMQGGCPCENTAGLRWDACNPELAAAFAPKPQLLVSASGDWTRETPQREFPFVRSIYAQLGAADAIENAHFDAGHNYDAATRRAVYAFLQRWLFASSEPLRFEEEPLPPLELLPFYAVPPERDALPSAERIEELLRAAVEVRAAALAPRDAASLTALRRLVQEGLAHAAGSAWPRREEVEHRAADEHGVEALVRNGRTLRFRREGSGGRVVLFADLGGLEAPALASELRGQAVLVRLQIFGTGATLERITASERGRTRYFSTFHRTTECEMLEDFATALTWFGGDAETRSMTLVARGATGAIALAALARFDPELARSIDLEAELELGSSALLLPNVERMGGLSALLAVQPLPQLHLRGAQHLREPSWARTAAALERRSLRLVSSAQR